MSKSSGKYISYTWANPPKGGDAKPAGLQACLHKAAGLLNIYYSVSLAAFMSP